jgi:hypothetical protein
MASLECKQNEKFLNYILPQSTLPILIWERVEEPYGQGNESGGIKPLLITIITRTGYSSINLLPFPPSLLLVVLDL